MIIYSLFLFCLGYLIGSIPFGYIFGKINHFDIRQFGSGNIGATNISRKFGIKGFLFVGLLDFLKSYLFVLSIFSLPQISLTQKLIISLSPILGHIFSLFLNFKGGKGVSCTYGLLTVILGWKFILIWFVVWLVTLLISRYMSLTNLIMALSFPIIYWVYFHTSLSIIIGTILTLIIFITHRQNIKKLIKGKEIKYNCFLDKKMISTINFNTLGQMLTLAYKKVVNKKESINSINMFPVPDKDTGDNLTATLEGVYNAINQKPFKNITEFRDAAIDGAICNASGNIGIIITGFLNGFLTNLYKNTISIVDFKNAFSIGMVSAYESIQNPKEGTILDVIQGANDSLSSSSIKDDFKTILKNAIKKAKDSLSATQLKMNLYLKTATIDAGGYGFLLMLEGFLEGIKGKNSHININKKISQKTTNFFQIINHRYEVISLLQSPIITKEEIVKELISYGDSLDIVQANQKIKIHIHTDLPDKVINLISQYGTIINTKTTDMAQQINENNQKQAVGLVVDSTASLNPDFTLENDISVVQFKAKWEKVDQKIADPKISIYQKMKLFENKTEKYGWPKTPQPSPQSFLIAFKEQLQKYNIVICITASSAVSGSYNSSLQARSFLPISDQNRVIIPDFRQVGPGQAFLTIKATELIKQGYSHQQIEKSLFSMASNLKVFVIPNKLSWIVKGGRVNGNKAKIVNFLQKLNFRPTFYLTPKSIGIMKIYFGHKNVSSLINKYLKQITKKIKTSNLPLKLIIQHSCEIKIIKQLIQKIDSKKFQITHNSLLSPVLGIHAGPDSIAVAVLTQNI